MRILREPLLHFLVVGSLLFFYLSTTDTEIKPQVTISQGKIKQLTAQFSKRQQREPSEDELQALIEIQIREYLAFKEGEEMGLIANDSIIKRRIQQKIEFMLNDSITSIDPTEEALEAYLKKHQERYVIEPSYTFKQIYLNPEQHENLNETIAALKVQELTTAYKTLGDNSMLKSEYAHISTSGIARLFGLKFSKSLDDIALHTWSAPVKSGYGVHLVYIEDKVSKHNATLAQVRLKVKRDYRAEAQKKALDDFYNELKKKYNVRIEKESQ